MWRGKEWRRGGSNAAARDAARTRSPCLCRPAGFAAAGVPKRYGLLFFNQILASPTLPASASFPFYTIDRKSFSDIKPNSRVLFVAACDFDDVMNQWMTVYKSSAQAYIVPKVPDIPTFLGAASAAWVRMLLDLGDGHPANTALASGNQYLIDHPPNPLPQDYVRPTWKAIGDQNVTFKASQ